jgi:hypothetical protein
VVVVFGGQLLSVLLQLAGGDQSLLQGQFFQGGQSPLVIGGGIAGLLRPGDMLDKDAVELSTFVPAGIGETDCDAEGPALPGLMKRRLRFGMISDRSKPGRPADVMNAAHGIL